MRETGKAAARILLAGERGIGKTSACREAARLAAARGLSVGGLVCPSRRDAAGLPVEIEAESLASGERRLLASRSEELEGPAWPPPGRGGPAPLRFSASAFAWAEAELRAALGSELLLLDEVGPLELRLGLGFRPFLDLLAAAIARPRESSLPLPALAAISVRPSLAAELAGLLGPGARILAVELSSRSALPLGLALEAERLARGKSAESR